MNIEDAVELLGDPSPDLRSLAASSLYSVFLRELLCMPSRYEKILACPHPSLFIETACKLKSDAAVEALAELIEAKTDDDPEVRRVATVLLGVLFGEAIDPQRSSEDIHCPDLCQDEKHRRSSVAYDWIDKVLIITYRSRLDCEDQQHGARDWHIGDRCDGNFPQHCPDFGFVVCCRGIATPVLQSDYEESRRKLRDFIHQHWDWFICPHPCALEFGEVTDSAVPTGTGSTADVCATLPWWCVTDFRLGVPSSWLASVTDIGTSTPMRGTPASGGVARSQSRDTCACRGTGSCDACATEPTPAQRSLLGFATVAAQFCSGCSIWWKQHAFVDAVQRGTAAWRLQQTSLLE